MDTIIICVLEIAAFLICTRFLSPVTALGIFVIICTAQIIAELERLRFSREERDQETDRRERRKRENAGKND